MYRTLATRDLKGAIETTDRAHNGLSNNEGDAGPYAGRSSLEK